MAWYSHLLKNFLQFVVIHTVRDFSIINEAEVDIFLELPFFLYNLMNVDSWSFVPLSLQNSACTSGSSQFMYC